MFESNFLQPEKNRNKTKIKPDADLGDADTLAVMNQAADVAGQATLDSSHAAVREQLAQAVQELQGVADEDDKTPIAVGIDLDRYKKATFSDPKDWDNAFDGRYEMTDVLGSGGMGAVYKLEDKKFGVDRIAKVIHTERLSPESISRFESEAILAAKINHPNIVKVIDYKAPQKFDGGEQTDPVLIQEYVEGEDLKEQLSTRLLSLSQKLEIARDIQSGLTAAHKQGVIHRDIKPANILITDDGQVKIADFGLATLEKETPPIKSFWSKAKDYIASSWLFKKQEESTEKNKTRYVRPEITSANGFVGTPHYMPPEQASGLPAVKSSDTYSLGATMYQMLVGKPVFADKKSGSKSPIEYVLAQIHEQPTNPTELNPKIPQEVSDVVLQMLEKDPFKRPKDEELEERLDLLSLKYGGVQQKLAMTEIEMSSLGFIQDPKKIESSNVTKEVNDALNNELRFVKANNKVINELRSRLNEMLDVTDGLSSDPSAHADLMDAVEESAALLADATLEKPDIDFFSRTAKRLQGFSELDLRMGSDEQPRGGDVYTKSLNKYLQLETQAKRGYPTMLRRMADHHKKVLMLLTELEKRFRALRFELHPEVVVGTLGASNNQDSKEWQAVWSRYGKDIQTLQETIKERVYKLESASK